MQIKQKTVLKVEKDGKFVNLVCDADLSLGLIFDALMEIKGYIVDRMVASHAEESSEAERQMGAASPVEESPVE